MVTATYGRQLSSSVNMTPNMYTFSFVQNVKYSSPNYIILPDCTMPKEL